MERGKSGLTVGSAWVKWECDLQDVGVGRPEVLTRLQDTHARITQYVNAKGKGSDRKLRR